MKNTLVCLLSGLLALQSLSATEIPLKWSDLDGTLRDQDVQLTLPDGATIRGTAVAVQDDALVVEVRQTSDRKVYPKGPATIPRKLVTVVTLRRKKGSAGRVIGKTLGALGGLVASGEIIAHSGINSEGGAIAVLLGVTTAASLAGHYGGRAMDVRVTTIRVVP